eukprot:TRINITY_DN53441_c0_g1_i1.p1 TRINITY_DN53441_c0_g1~~TRINITY_DN53441_c0_g1_i1.p1  ORF type:complete len:101 (-),score=11.76 TRINITY_DN53441_c0_g1_i1:44-346(-)
MAPEFKKIGEVKTTRFQADIWSFGAVIVEMLTLDVPPDSLAIDPIFLPTVPAAKVEEYAPFVEVFKSCCRFNYKNRPTARAVLAKLIAIENLVGEGKETL